MFSIKEVVKGVLYVHFYPVLKISNYFSSCGVRLNDETD
jgi:hypothetical protein